MPFERFVKTKRSYGPTASLRSRGQIGLNKCAVQRFNLADYTFAVLFYDPQTQRIGIKLTNNAHEPGVLVLTRMATGMFISAKSFLDFHQIAHAETQKYQVDYHEEEALYIFDLRTPFAHHARRVRRDPTPLRKHA